MVFKRERCPVGLKKTKSHLGPEDVYSYVRLVLVVLAIGLLVFCGCSSHEEAPMEYGACKDCKEIFKLSNSGKDIEKMNSLIQKRSKEIRSQIEYSKFFGYKPPYNFGCVECDRICKEILELKKAF